MGATPKPSTGTKSHFGLSEVRRLEKTRQSAPRNATVWCTTPRYTTGSHVTPPNATMRCTVRNET